MTSDFICGGTSTLALTCWISLEESFLTKPFTLIKGNGGRSSHCCLKSWCLFTLCRTKSLPGFQRMGICYVCTPWFIPEYPSWVLQQNFQLLISTQWRCGLGPGQERGQKLIEKWKSVRCLKTKSFVRNSAYPLICPSVKWNEKKTICFQLKMQ